MEEPEHQIPERSPNDMNFLRRLAPPRFSPLWLVYGLVFAALVAAALCAHLYYLQDWSATIAWRRVLLAIGLSAVVHLPGWLGFRLLWLCGAAGVVIGVSLLVRYTLEGMDGWGDLIGALTMLFIIGIGLAVGAAAEIILSLWKWYRKNKSRA